MNAEPTKAAPLPSASGPSAGGNSTALDQWRGFALVLVLISHGFYFTNRVHGLGRVGVNLFFFISGILVYRSLSQSRQPTALKIATSFLKKRCLRLYPALLAYLVAMTGLVYLLQDIPRAVNSSFSSYLHSVPLALAYVINYGPQQGPMALGHIWSLACEMQFYLLSPLIFLVGGRNPNRRNVTWGLLLLALLAGGIVGALFDRSGERKYHFEVATWPMMLGFFCEYRREDFARISAQWARRIIVLAAIVFLGLLAVMISGRDIKKLVVAIGALALVPCFLGYVTNLTMGGQAGRTLAWIGERTYSIYLWQQPLTICRYLPDLLHPVGAITSILVGGLWFKLFERPFLSARRQEITNRP